MKWNKYMVPIHVVRKNNPSDGLHPDEGYLIGKRDGDTFNVLGCYPDLEQASALCSLWNFWEWTKRHAEKPDFSTRLEDMEYLVENSA